jgi:hypothetical protein
MIARVKGDTEFSRQLGPPMRAGGLRLAGCVPSPYRRGIDFRWYDIELSTFQFGICKILAERESNN